MSLKTRKLNVSLAGGYTSEGLEKDGSHGTFVAIFSNMQGGADAKLQQSVDGDAWSDVPGSETTIEAGETERMWTENIMPRGTMVRMNITETTGNLVAIKLLSNE